MSPGLSVCEEEEEGGWGGGGVGGGAEITVNVTLPPLSIIHFQSIAVPGFCETAWR